MSKPILDALNGIPQERPPFWFMRQAGRYLPEYRATRAQAGNFLDLCYNPELATEVTLQPIRRYNMDAAILFADILLIPHGLGQKLDYIEGEGPVLDPIRSADQLAKLDLASMDQIVGPVYETVRRVRRELPAQTTLIGFAGAPWTVATYMVEGRGSRDFPHIKAWSYEHPDSFQKLMDLLIDATVHYLNQQIQAGADTVQLFDTWAGALTETGFEKWVIGPTQSIVKKLKETHPDIPIIGFPKGSGALLAKYAELTGVDAVGLDWSQSLDYVCSEIPDTVAVQGNLDPQLLLVGGEIMLSEARRILDKLSYRPFIFNLGHGITPKVPPEHVAQLCDLLHGYRVS